MKIKRIIRIVRVIFHDIISHIVYCVEEEEKHHKMKNTNTTINLMWTGVQRLSLGGKNNGYYVFNNSVLCCYYGDYNNILRRNKCRKEI